MGKDKSIEEQLRANLKAFAETFAELVGEKAGLGTEERQKIVSDMLSYSSKDAPTVTLRRVLNEESDRGCVLAAAAFLDDRLSELLKAGFVNDRAVVERVFGGNGVLATFSSKIDLALLLGHISKAAHKDLQIIRRIRNEFAHSCLEATFGSDSVMDRCRELHHDAYQEAIDGSKSDSRGLARARFQRVSTALSVLIDGAIDRMDKAVPAADLEIDSRAFELMTRLMLGVPVADTDKDDA
mgnify:CR=1 FL=1